jgi:hypothetical protein
MQVTLKKIQVIALAIDESNIDHDLQTQYKVLRALFIHPFINPSLLL